MDGFDPVKLKELYKSRHDSMGEENGQVTIVGGSKLFHGAPLLSLKVASRIVDMVFFASPEHGVGKISEKIKSKLMSFIWVPWEEVEAYIEKSDAVLVGPGLMRYAKESQKLKAEGQNEHLRVSNYDVEGKKTKKITERLLKNFPNKRYVVDAGSLQVMETKWIPKGAVLTPNIKEFEMLFDVKLEKSNIKAANKNAKIAQEMAKKFNCTIILKTPKTIVCSPEACVVVGGGNAGMTKGGVGDVLAGLTLSLLAKNDPFLAAACASYLTKYAADSLHSRVGTNYNADDLADEIPGVLKRLTAS